jgi:hypothetical protein
MYRVMTLIGCVLLGLVQIGCEESAPLSPQVRTAAPAATPAVAESSKLEKGHVQFEAASTTKLLTVVSVETERVAKGLLRITLRLQNNTSSKLWTDISTVFFDAKGGKLEQTTWEPTLLKDKAVTEYICTSLSNQAADYRIIVRKPNRSSLEVP